MKKMKVINEKLTRQLSNVGFKLKKHSPELLVAAGIVCGIGSIVTACVATTKVDEILGSTKEKVDQIHNGVEKGEIKGQEYTAEDSKKDLTIVYVQTGLKFIKLYSPAFILGVLSVTGILGSHHIIKERNVALTAAFATVNDSFKSYRKRVAERFGDEIERELKLGIEKVESEEVTVDENGNAKTEKTVTKVASRPKYSDFAKVFDETNPNYKKSAEYNLVFIKQVENWANDKLRVTGRLFLNEVYDALGFEPTKAGQVVGWVYDPESRTSDSYVDFGLYDVNNEKARDFVNGYERAIVLDFNVDGNVWETM
ncbi:MAG: DUF6353 family protein [Ruminococcus sp.]|nr:DUF6353 family protein [Ruminococcus sp.]